MTAWAKRIKASDRRKLTPFLASWMNEISDDGAYKIYVDAFSGTETDVTVTIFIKGSTVATVDCGDMSSGSSTDSCFVGTIAWSGGTSGSGTFTASGTKASTF